MIRLSLFSLPSAGRRLGAAATLLGALALASVACSDRLPTGGVAPDDTRPTVSIAGGTPAADTLIAVSVTAHDDLGLKQVLVQVRGAVTLDTVITFNSVQKDVTIPIELAAPRTVSPGTTVTVSAQAFDGRNNASEIATTTATVGNLPAPVARVVSPLPNTDVAVAGSSFDLTIFGSSPVNIRSLGFRISGAFTTQDSVLYALPFPAEASERFTVQVPASARGDIVIRPFLRDELGQVQPLPTVPGDSVVLTILSTPPANSRPVVTVGINNRIETTDTINIRATDPAQIASVSYEVRNLTGDLLANVSAPLPATSTRTSIDTTLQLNLPITLIGQRVVFRAFATNRQGNIDTARVSGVLRVDTVLVVAGVTRPLPTGGVIADAYYHAGKNRVYMSNIERNRLEVLDIATLNFTNAIVTGSRPWGIAPWPRDRSGNVGDTLLVANSGGTSISYINLNSGVAGQPTGIEAYRYPLPNIIAYTVTSERSATTGGIITTRTKYDFSDRPQWVAATCQGAATAGSPCGDVVAVYSTTPTGGQSTPFANRGTVRYENLTRRSSHFFFEQAVGTGAQRSDTLEVERYAAADATGGFVGSDSLLVPFLQVATNSSGAAVPFSVTVSIDLMAFRDTTFVRNSGNFRRAIIGEGGSVVGARAVGYDASQGLDPTGAIQGFGYRGYTLTLPVADRGISRPADVTDFIANTFARVRGVGINFDGELSAIRGDSTFLLDATLRLQGLLQTSGGNAGFDFHPRNTGRNSLPLSTRLAFAASTEPVIEVYDSYCFQRVRQIPVREPIIGPIKAAYQAAGNNIVLVGAGSRGAVIVTLSAADPSLATSCP